MKFESNSCVYYGLTYLFLNYRKFCIIKMKTMKIQSVIFIICASYIQWSWGLDKGCSMEIVIDPHFYQYYQSKSTERYTTYYVWL